MLPIFYINLATRPDRKRFMENQFSSRGVQAFRVEAVTPADISAQDKAKYCNTQQPFFLRENELACTLSHELAWRAMLKGGFKKALILEDDVELSELLPSFLEEAKKIDLDLIRIETTGVAVRVYPIQSTGPSGVSIRGFRSTPMGSAGYILSAEAAERLIGNPQVRRTQLDLAIYNPFEEPGRSLSRGLADPALCRQLGYEGVNSPAEGRSDIAHDRVKHAFAEQHPIRFFLFRLSNVLRHGLRNAVDHFAQQRNGLERRVIPFARAAGMGEEAAKGGHGARGGT